MPSLSTWVTEKESSLGQLCPAALSTNFTPGSWADILMHMDLAGGAGFLSRHREVY